MQPDQAADYVAGIMRRNEIDFGTSEDGRSHQITYGSTAVHVNLAPAGDDDTIISLSAVVLEQLDEERRSEILERLNELNCGNYFGKFCLYDSTIRVEHELLASRMQGEEFMSALGIVAEHSDRLDDALQKKLGGRTWQQVDEDARSEQEALDT